MKSVQVRYFAILREERGLSEETVDTSAADALGLFHELARRHNFSLEPERMKVVVNEEFRDWTYRLAHGDSVVFIPPVAGG